ncbi:MAG: TIGR03435 family protein [Ignavibacteriota bacterium]
MRYLIFPIVIWGVMLGQTPSRSPAFDAASIKVTPRGSSGSIKGGPGTKDPGRFVATNASLFNLVMKAWTLRPYQISGLSADEPEAYDIIAKVPDGATHQEFLQMLQALLAERFGLVVHHESKELPVYELTIAKGGLKIKEVPDPAQPAASASPKDGQPVMTIGGAQPYQGHLRIVANGQPVSGMVKMMELQSGRPVIDKSGLTGFYDYSLEFAPDPLSGPRPGIDPNDASPDFLTAVVKQMGLKLDPKKDPVDTLRVDRFNRVPTAN